MAVAAAEGRRLSLGGRLSLAVLCVAALLLAVATVRRTAARQFETSDPALALTFEADDTAARENLANQRLAAALASKGVVSRASALQSVEAEGRRALVEGALHWAALRDLGVARDAEGRRNDGEAVMARVSLRGRRDVAAWAWWLQRDLAAARWPASIDDLDAILRSQPELAPKLAPVIAALLTQPGVSSLMAIHLAPMGAPPPNWRDAVLLRLALKDPDEASVIELHRSLQRRKAPPSDGEAAELLYRMVKEGRYAEARDLWRERLSLSPRADSPLIYDGDFKGLPGAQPFNWKLTQQPSGDARIEHSADVGTVLVAEYPASTAGLIATQLLILPPGAYRLAGRWRFDAAPGAALTWTLTCVSGAAGPSQTRTPMTRAMPWSQFGVDLVVPPDCPAEWLQLGTTAADGFSDARIAVTRLVLSPRA